MLSPASDQNFLGSRLSQYLLVESKMNLSHCLKKFVTARIWWLFCVMVPDMDFRFWGHAAQNCTKGNHFFCSILFFFCPNWLSLFNNTTTTIHRWWFCIVIFSLRLYFFYYLLCRGTSNYEKIYSTSFSYVCLVLGAMTNFCEYHNGIVIRFEWNFVRTFEYNIFIERFFATALALKLKVNNVFLLSQKKKSGGKWSVKLNFEGLSEFCAATATHNSIYFLQVSSTSSSVFSSFLFDVSGNRSVSTPATSIKMAIRTRRTVEYP